MKIYHPKSQFKEKILSLWLISKLIHISSSFPLAEKWGWRTISTAYWLLLHCVKHPTGFTLASLFAGEEFLVSATKEAEGENLHNLATVTEMWVAEPGLPESKALKTVSFSKLGEWSNNIKSDHIRFMSASWDLVWPLLLCWRKWKTRLRSLEAEFSITHEWKHSSYPLVPPVSRTMGCGWPHYLQLPRKTHSLF